MQVSLKRLAAALSLAFVFLLLTSANAFASHFRYGSITYSYPDPTNPNLVTFRVDAGFRRSFYSPVPVVGGPLVDSGTALVVTDAHGNQISSTEVMLTVESINSVDDWFYGSYSVNVTLPAPGTYTATYANCCRSSLLADNNHDQNFSLYSTVNTVAAPLLRSPVTTMLPVSKVAVNQPTTLRVPAATFNGQPATFSVAPLANSGLVVAQPTGLTLSPSSGVINWTPTATGLYAMQVLVTDGLTTTPVDFILEVVAQSAAIPTLTVNGNPSATFTAFIGYPRQFTLTATTLNNGGTSVISVSSTALPDTALMAPALPVSGSGTVSSTFTWTPTLGASGSYTVLFQASDDTGGVTSVVPVTINIGTAQILYVSGIVRNFAATDPDFNKPDGDNAIRLVSTTLGGDGKPVFSPTGTSTTVANTGTFNQWFNKSASQVFSFTLSNANQADPSVYAYDNPDFLPLGNTADGRLFTYEVHSYVQYTPGQVLQFSSSDDLWIFINNKLAVDLGGVHVAPRSATLNMDAFASTNGLSAGQVYEMAYFYAHRSGTHDPQLDVQASKVSVCDPLAGTATPIDVTAMKTTGSAHVVTGAPNRMRLINKTDVGPSGGTAWTANSANVAAGFEVDFDFQQTRAVAGTPAEGFAFVLQAQGPAAFGGDGGNLEYAPIAKSLAVEFDSNQDTALNDPPYQHIAAHSLWNLPNSANETGGAQLGISTFDSASPLAFDNGTAQHARIVYTPALTLDGYGWLRVWMGTETVPRMEAQISAQTFANTFGAVWLGFTASTAGSPSATAADVDIFNVTVSEAQAATATLTGGAPAPMLSNETGHVSLQARDVCNAPIRSGGASFAAQMANGAQTTPVTVTDNLDGTYTLSYTPPAAGTWSLSVAINGSPLAGSPYAVTVFPNPRVLPTLTATGGTFTYNGAAHPALITLKGINNVTLPDLVGVTYNGVPAFPVFPGTYAVTAYFGGNDTYLPATATTSITIGGTIPAQTCGTFDPPISLPASAMTLVGNASLTGTGNSRIRIANALGPDLTSAAWMPYQTQMVRGFSAEFDFQTTGPTPEGFAFVMQSLDAATPAVGSGASLGYNFTRNIAVEFDMAKTVAFSDPNANHIEVHAPNGAGALNSANESNALPASATTIPIMSDGTVHHALVTYTHSGSGSGAIQIFIDRSTTAVATVAVPDSTLLAQFPNDVAWLGFTSGTSQTPANIDISSIQVASGGYSTVTSGLSVPLPTVNLGDTATATLQLKDACGNPMPTSAPLPFAATLTQGASSTWVTVTDNGDGTYTFAYTPPAAGSWSLAISYNGVALSSGPYNVVVVPDTTPPVVTPPPAVTTGTGPSNSGATVVVTDAALGSATATDNFGHPVTIVRSGVPAGNLFPIGTTTVIYTGTDQAGNSSNATQLVTVNDSTPPIITLPADVAASTGAGNADGTVVVSDSMIGAASATDNSGATPALVRSGVPAGNVFPIGTTTITYTATDGANNSTSAVQHVVVSDMTPPSIVAPANVTAGTGPGNPNPSVAVLDATLGSATATDNSGGSATVTRSGVPAGNIFPIGSTTITYTATDISGNSSTATQLVIVNDTTAPAITAPAAVTLGTTLANLLVTDAVLGSATSSDNSGGPVTVTRSGVPDGNAFSIGTTTVTYTATDAAGNVATATQQVVVNDTGAPVITAPVALTAFTGAGNPGATTVVNDALIGTATASDNSGATIIVSRAGVPAGNVFPLGTTTITYTATDPAGNSSTATQVVTVKDNTVPVIDAPANVTTTTIAAVATVADAVLGAATASDNTGAAPAITRTGVPPENLFPIGTTTVTYTAADAAGNTATATQLVLVKDGGAPVLTAPPALSVNTGTAATMISDATLGTATATDNSGAAPAIVRSGVPAGNLFPLGTTTITYTATDAAGNSASATQLVTAVDNVGPSIGVPANQTVAATSASGAVVTYPAATAADAGSGLATLTCLPVSGSTFPVGATTVTCTATDRAGNSSAATFTVTVSAYSPPPQPDGRMTGDGHINEGSAHYHFVFRASQIHLADYAKVEFWVHDPKVCRNSDDDDDDDGRNGDTDRDYGRRHCNPTSVLDSTVVTAVTFSDDPGFSPDNDKKNKAPKPAVDTVQIIGSGRWNGKAGYTFVLNATDQGEPGRNHDTFKMVVKDSRGAIVASVSDTLDGGNIQSTRLK